MHAYVLVGRSHRLPHKHLMEILPGKRLIDLVVENLKNIGLEVVIYSKFPIEADAPVVMDHSTWILPAVLSLLEMDEGFFLFGGDMPLIKKEAVKTMLQAWDGVSTMVPRWSDTGYLEPLHAIYTRAAKVCLRNGKSLSLALKNCPAVKFLSAETLPKETYFNVNTSQDLENLKTILAKH